jgi:hypothetical protein
MGKKFADVHERPALVGDIGVVVAWRSLGMSGCGQLAIALGVTPWQVTSRALIPGTTTIALLTGDWRPIRDTYEACQLREVEVVESEGSGYGCHGVRLIE